jgi:hypothetical protein
MTKAQVLRLKTVHDFDPNVIVQDDSIQVLNKIINTNYINHIENFIF